MMTGFDFAVLGVVGLSTVIGLLRGLIRSLVSLVAWIAAGILALLYGDVVAVPLTAIPLPAPVALAFGFVLVFLAVVIAGALVGLLLARLLRAVGLGFVDRLLGTAFGALRGMVLVIVVVLLAGLTALPQQDWWQNSRFTAPLARLALSLRPYLPPDWASQLDYSAARPATRGAVLQRPPQRT